MKQIYEDVYEAADALFGDNEWGCQAVQLHTREQIEDTKKLYPDARVVYCRNLNYLIWRMDYSEVAWTKINNIVN